MNNIIIPFEFALVFGVTILLIFIIFISKPENFYKIFRIPYTVYYLRDKNTNIKRGIIRDSKIKNGLFSAKDGKHLVDPEAQSLNANHPAYLYKWGNICPLKISAEDEVDFTSIDLEMAIGAKVISDFGKLGEEALDRFLPIIIILAIVCMGIFMWLSIQDVKESVVELGKAVGNMSRTVPIEPPIIR